MSAPANGSGTASLIVVNPSGNRRRVPLEPVPFQIGRQPENQLVLRDNRISRTHAQIVREDGQFVLEDLKSRHGLFLNGTRISRERLHPQDRIEFGFPDSYKLIFTLEEDEIHRLMDQFSAAPLSPAPGAGNLAKLRALVEVARSLQNSLSTDEVLTAVVDAALAITNAERGFLLLRQGEDLDVRVARDHGGNNLGKDDLRVPTGVIARALDNRRELLSMHFDPESERQARPDATVAHLELRSVICVPLVRVRTQSTQETLLVTKINDTVGLLYLDSRQNATDLSSGNRELVQTLALEASTILENSRLLEEERQKQRLEEELRVARTIQSSLLPRSLPSTGWFRAAGSSVPSQQVGGDYFDVRQAAPGLYSALLADVSGKGVSSALLASLLQGAFLLADERLSIPELLSRVNQFLLERTEGEKYVTLFYATLDRSGRLTYANAGHCEPVLIRGGAPVARLGTTSVPVGMLPMAPFATKELMLHPGDKLVVYSDGLSEAQDPQGLFFDHSGFRASLQQYGPRDSAGLHAGLLQAVHEFTEGSPQSDDITVLVLEYQPE